MKRIWRKISSAIDFVGKATFFCLFSIFVLLPAFISRTIYGLAIVLAAILLAIFMLIVGIIGGIIHLFVLMLFPGCGIQDDNPQADVRIFG